MKKLSGVHQTSCVEAFHSLITHFAAKMFAYSYRGMKCRYSESIVVIVRNKIPFAKIFMNPTSPVPFVSRTFCSAMHYNENTQRNQATTQDGSLCYDVRYPKYKKGGHIVRKVLQNPTYGKLF